MSFRLNKMRALGWLVVTVLASGCATVPDVDISVNESAQGAVYIERIPDTKFQAAHPIKLDKEVIARTLRGVYVRTETSTLQTIFSNSLQSNPIRAFSDEDVDYLAPHIVKALTQAVADQRVGFRVVHPAPPIRRSNQSGAGIGSSDPIPSPGTETTEGNLYVYGTSLNVTLTKFRYRPERPDTINMPNRRLPDNTGLKLTDVLFYPPDARRPESYQPSKLLGEPLLTTLVIDYQLLAKLPTSMLVPPAPKMAEGDHAAQPAAPTPSAAPSAASSVGTEDTVREREALKELESLKEDMQKLRRQMEQQQEEMEKLKEKPQKKRPGNAQ